MDKLPIGTFPSLQYELKKRKLSEHGNLLRGIVIWSGAAPSIYSTTDLCPIRLYLSFENSSKVVIFLEGRAHLIS